MEILERDFERFVDLGDPDALGRVFDATAGRLSLLAAHLGGAEGSGGDDLVQATFLAAMRRGSTWDRRRPLWPWLAMILHNEARMQWRRQRQRREVGLEAAADAVGAGADPALLVAGEEVLDAVARAIDALPVDYRQVMRLRLVHGMAPVDIARALELPVGTVRVRLHRGRQRLRAAVPASIAGAIALLLNDSGLPQVRDEVMKAAAGRTVAATTGTVVLGGLLTKKTAVVGVAIVLIAVALGLSWASFGAPVEQHDSIAGSPAAALAAAPVVAADEVPVRRKVPPVAESDWSLLVTVDTPEQQPIPNAVVVVEIQPKGSEDLPREFVARGRTGADGTFRCDLDGLRSSSLLYRSTNLLRVTASAPRHLTRYWCVRLPNSPGADAAERPAVRVILMPGLLLTGRVQDVHGNEVGGARFVSVRPRIEESLTVRIADDGSFRIVVLPRGPLVSDEIESADRPRLVVTEPRHGVASASVPTAREIVAAGGQVDLGTLTLDPGATLRGVVLLGDGSPLGEFPIDLLAMPESAPVTSESFHAAMGPVGKPKRGRFEVRADDSPFRRRARCKTAPDGSFVFSGLDPLRRYAVGVRDTVGRWTVAEVAAGGDAVRFVVDKHLLRIDVRSAQGEPLPGASIMAMGWSLESKQPAEDPYPGFPSTRPWVVASSHPADAAGRRLLLSSPAWIWRIGPSDEIARSEFVRHDAVGMHRTDLELVLRPEQQLGAVRLAVVDAGGERVHRYFVRLMGLDKPATRQEFVSEAVAEHVLKDVPAGRWQLTIGVGQPVRSYDCFTRGFHGREVIVRDGAMSDVRVEVPAGALVRLRMTADRTPEDGIRDIVVRAAASGDALSLVRRGPVPGGPGPLPVGVLSRAEVLIQQPLPPGRHSLIVEAAGFQPAVCTVDVTDGELVRTTVELFAR